MLLSLVSFSIPRALAFSDMGVNYPLGECPRLVAQIPGSLQRFRGLFCLSLLEHPCVSAATGGPVSFLAKADADAICGTGTL